MLVGSVRVLEQAARRSRAWKGRKEGRVQELWEILAPIVSLGSRLSTTDKEYKTHIFTALEIKKQN